jgi:hypothetical protein
MSSNSNSTSSPNKNEMDGKLMGLKSTGCLNFFKKNSIIYPSPDWEAQFLDVFQKRIPRILLDHFPLLLHCGVAVGSSQYFKFENIWLKSKGFVEQLKQEKYYIHS